jgi:hypothetical protein
MAIIKVKNKPFKTKMWTQNVNSLLTINKTYMFIALQELEMLHTNGIYYLHPKTNSSNSCIKLCLISSPKFLIKILFLYIQNKHDNLVRYLIYLSSVTCNLDKMNYPNNLSNQHIKLHKSLILARDMLV